MSRRIVITGGSFGMGRATAEAFLKEGDKVLFTARRTEKAEEFLQEYREYVDAGKLFFLQSDISKDEDVIHLAEYAKEVLGGCDVLVNNAGVMDDMSPIGDVKNEKIEQVFQVNVFGPMYAMRKAVHVFLEQGDGGNIINVASLGAFRSVAGAVYSASKAALVSLTKNTAFMYMPQGIRCNAIAPGGIVTEISSSMGMPNKEGYGRVKHILAAAPPPGEAEQIAAAALFLASDESSYVNGDVLVVDGGWNAG